jgi:hypothetical protein
VEGEESKRETATLRGHSERVESSLTYRK